MAEHRYAVIWAPHALNDFDRLIEFIAQRNPLNAKTIFQKIRRRAESLSTFPLRNRLVPELALIGIDTYRELVMDPYRLIFRIVNRHVLIIGLFDGRRDLEEVLFDRLIHP